MDSLILNDGHIGVMRVAGTTPATANGLRAYLRSAISHEMLQHTDKHIIWNGDLLDKFEVPLSEVLATHYMIAEWCEKSDPQAKMFLLAGNHDISARGDKVSSFEFLVRILEAQHEGKVVPVLMEGLSHLYDKVWAIPHCANQDLFDMELERAMSVVPEGGVLLLHANYDNNFAADADHSLNVSEEMADKLIEKGIRLVFGHEHNKRVLKGGMVYIAGNQWPSSIVDCLDPNKAKYAHVLGADGQITPYMTTNLEEVFTEVDWKEMAGVQDVPFIRIVGSCTQEQSGDVIQAISKLRQKSGAFVVANSVKVQGLDLSEFEGISFDSIKAFDVLGELMELLEPEERKVVTELLEQD